MTGKRRPVDIDKITNSFGSSALNFEIRKTTKGALCIISGIISISEYNAGQIELLSHSGRVIIEGERLEISVLENRTVEIYGRITEVKLTYGKN